MPTTTHSGLTGANLHEPKGASSAAANTVYVANGAGSGTWQKTKAASQNSDGAADGYVLTSDGANGAAYEAPVSFTHGQMSVNGNSTATAIATLGTYVAVAEGTPASSELSGITFSTDHLIIPTTGVYKIDVAISFEGTTDDTYIFAIGLNGTTPIGTPIKRKTPSAYVDTLMLSEIKSLTASDEIYLLVQNATDTDDPTLTDWTMNITRLS